MEVELCAETARRWPRGDDPGTPPVGGPGRCTGWRRLGPLVAALGGLLLAGCQGVPAPPADYLVIGIETAPTSLDPRTALDATSAQVTDLVFRGLSRPGDDGGFLPDLADGWSHQGLEWTFHLRPARFHDGSPVRAADVVATWRSLARAEMRGLRSSEWEPIASVDAPDEATVRFVLREPHAPFLASTTIGIVTERCAASGRDCDVGNGPFRFVARGVDTVTLAAAETADPRPSLPGIVLRASPDGASRALGLARGSIDLVQNAVEPELLPWLEGRGLSVASTPGSNFQYLGFNLDVPALRDPRVRRAIASAIDVPAIIAGLLAGRARPAGELLPPGHWAHAGRVPPTYDPALARYLLDEAGVHGLRLQYKTTTVDLRRRMAEAIAGYLRAVGIDVEIRPLEWAALYGDVRRGNFELVSLAWVGISDPDLYYGWLHSSMRPPRGNNRGGYSNPLVDHLTSAARAEDATDRRTALYRQVAAETERDLPFVPLWWVDNTVVHTRRLVGFAPSPSGDLRGLVAAGWDGGPPPRGGS
ncbi:MAG: hypothetical protein RL698_160 [Pseudomonadota bacterium]